MTTYYEYKVNLSEGQKEKLAKAVENSSPITLRLSKNTLVGNDEMMLTKSQINKLQKAKQKNSGAEIKISKSQIKKSIKQGGSLWTSLLKLTPFLTKGVSKGAPHLATGALSALGSLGIDKIFGSGVLPDSVVKMIQKGIEVPVKFLVNLINLDEMLTKAQKTLIGEGIQSGKGIVLKPTKKQIHGGLLGTLAAIGIPMAIELASKIFGKGLQVPQKAGMGLQVPQKAGMGLQVAPKPFLWQPPPSMEHGRGRERDFCWGKTVHSTKFPSWEHCFKTKMERYPPVKCGFVEVGEISENSQFQRNLFKRCKRSFT